MRISRRLVATYTLFILVIIQMIIPPVCSAQVDPSVIRAAFLYNFAKFSSTKVDSSEHNSLSICVLGDISIFNALIKASPKPIGGKSIVPRTPTTMAEAKPCSILYIGRFASFSQAEVSSINDSGVLTITEEGSGGIIEFVPSEEKLSFTIDLTRAGSPSLSLSSQLMRVAKAVKTKSQ